jgi:hypothetical protein
MTALGLTTVPPRVHRESGYDSVGVYLSLVSALLFGYATLGKPFAYVPVGPLFIGDVVLLLGAISLIFSPTRFRAAFARPLAPLYCLLVLGAVRLIGDLPQYGLLALRDAASCGYGLASIAVFAYLRDRWPVLLVFVSRYRLLVVLGPPTMMIVWICTTATGLYDFLVAGVPNPVLKGTDILIHALGMIAFISLGICRFRPAWLIPPCLLACLGVNTRAGVLAFALGLAACFVLGRRRRYIVAASTLLASTLLLAQFTGIDVPVPGSSRSFSARTVQQGMISLGGDVDDPGFEGPTQWRLRWWKRIVDYTVHGEYFWTGKGFGPNLADADGFAVSWNHALRNPHSCHLTFLARLGVPGALVWLALLISWFRKIVRAIWVSYKAGDSEAFRVLAFCFTYLMCIIIVASFDVAIEGPITGLWFWTIHGLGLAAATSFNGQSRTPVCAQ